MVLPFGLRSAPFIFNSIADMVEWILVNSYQIPNLLHYLDDFITAGPPQSLQCAHNLATAMEVCQQLGLPLHPAKCLGPSTVLVVLGIELDSDNQVARLLQEKLLALQNLIGSWLPRKWYNRHELESLIRHLHHAAKVVWPGWTFLRRMIDLLCCFPEERSPHSSQPRISSRSSMVAPVFGGLAWALASGSSQDCFPRLMLKYLLMLQAH